MKVEIYSDTVCPWCYVGKKRFELAARSRPDIDFDVRWLPFELNPEMPEAGVDRETYLAEKFGDLQRVRAMQARLHDLGSSLGLRFRFDRARRMPNTRASHAVLAFAAETGQQNAASEELFNAYFEAGRDVGDRSTLLEIGAGAGLDADELERALKERRHYPEIEELERQAHGWGITGVPTFIFERRYAVSGAQESAVFSQVFDRLLRVARAS